MVAPWIAPVAKSALTVWQAGATVGASLTFPPLVPVIAGVFAIAGIALDAGLKAAGEPEVKSHEQYVRESMEHALKSLDMINESIIDIRNFLNETSQETRETLRDIQLTLKTFEENMNRNFDELKNFMIEKDFIEKIQLPLKILWDLMQAASESQTEDSIDRFLTIYKAQPARNILAEFINRLEFAHTNPISSAMENHVLESRVIMDHYVKLLSHFVFKVLIIEGFYFGVSDVPRDSYPGYIERLSKDTDSAFSKFRNFVDSYKIPKEKYWPDIINKTIISNREVSDSIIKADNIKNSLEGIYTRDVFSIFVYKPSLLDTPEWSIPLPLLKFSNPEDIAKHVAPFGVIGRNNFTDFVFVFRSEKFHDLPPQSFSLLRSSFRSYAALMKRMNKKSCFPLGFPHFADLGNDPFLEILDETFNPNIVTGFTMCFHKGPVVTRFTNNGSSILTEEDTSIIPTYYGLTWM